MKRRAIMKRVLCVLLAACLIAPGLSIDAYANPATSVVADDASVLEEPILLEDVEETVALDELTDEEVQTGVSVSENTSEEISEQATVEESESESAVQESVAEEAEAPVEAEVVEEESAVVEETSEMVADDEYTGDEEEVINDVNPEYVEVDIDIDYGEMRYVTESELAEIMANSDGQNTIRKKIVNYAKSLNGTFPLNYYSTKTNKDGTTTKTYRCKQCMSYVNHVWWKIFNKDMWSKGITKDESKDGETVYEFLQRTGAKAGDILFTRYYKTKNNANYWSTHYVIVLGYDSNGVWITDGYQDSKTKKTIIWRIDEKSNFKDSKGKWGQYYRPDGSMSDKAGSRWKDSDQYGHFFRLYRVDNATWSKVANVPEVLPAKPTLSNVQVAKNVTKGTYTVTVDITAPGGLDRVQFPTWTEANGQDDLVSKWKTNSAVSGKITTLGNQKYKASFVVKIADHNGEQGNYLTHIYAYDTYGQSSKIEAPVTSMLVPPQIRSVSITKVNQGAGTYSIKVLVNKNVPLDRVQFPTWTEANGQDDLDKDWKTSEFSSGRIYNKDNSNFDYCTVEYTVKTSDHNNERGKYITHVYAYGENGASTKYLLSPVDFTTALSGTEENSDGSVYSWALVGEPGAYELLIDGSGDVYEYKSSGGYPWMPYIDEIVKLNIGEGINAIGVDAFKGLTNLKEVTFPSTLHTIDNNAFRGCSSLPDTLYLPESMYRLKAGAFRNTPVRNVVFTGEKLASYTPSLGEVESEVVLSGSNVLYENNTGDWIISDKTWTSDNEYTYTKISTEGILYTFYITLGGAFDESAVFYYDPTNEAWADSGDTYLGYKLIPLNKTITGLRLDYNDLSMVKGTTKSLTCTVEPEGETALGLVWSSEDESIATVSSTGVVTAVSEGSTVISVATKDGSYVVSCNVTVGTDITEIEFVNPDVTMTVGETDILKVDVFPEVAPSTDFIWSSDDAGIVSVDENGKITAQNMGSTIIRASLKDNEDVVTACSVTVMPDIISLSLSTEEVQLMPGETYQLSYVINPSNRADAEVIWSSSDTSVATVENGLVTANDSLSGGETVVTLKTEDGLFEASCVVTVVSQTVEDEEFVEADSDTVQITGFVEEMTYTGDKLTQDVKVYCGRTLLTENEDYTIKYSNNINAAAKTAKKAPKMTVTLKGVYTGTYSKTFTILPADITMDGVAESITVAANKKAQKIVPTVIFDEKTLKNKKDFTVKYPDSGDYKTARENPYTISVTGKGNYTGTRTYHLYIVALKPMKDVTVSKIAKQTYTGEEIKPHETVEGFVVKYKGVPVDASQYEVSYSDNTQVGTAKMIIAAKEDGEFTGQKVVSFTIKSRASLKNAKVNENVWKSAISYTSACGDEVRQDDNSPLLVVKVNGVNQLLDQNYYDITYKNNTKAGKATVTFKGKNGYDGTLKKTFTIKPYNIENSAGEVTVEAPATVYLKDSAKTVPVVTYNETVLTEGIDYTVSYKNYKAVRKPADKNPPTVIVKGKGKFKGTLSEKYEITKQDIGMLTISVKDVEQGKNYESKPTVTDLNGKKLKAGMDYTVEYYIADEFYDNYPDVGTVVYITVTGKGNYFGSLKSSYTVVPKDIAKAKVTVKNQVYKGSAVCPGKDQITVKIGSKKLTEADYEIVGYKENTKVGKGKVILRGTGNYGGTITVTFKINPKKLTKWL